MTDFNGNDCHWNFIFFGLLVFVVVFTSLQSLTPYRFIVPALIMMLAISKSKNILIFRMDLFTAFVGLVFFTYYFFYGALKRSDLIAWDYLRSSFVGVFLFCTLYLSLGYDKHYKNYILKAIDYALMVNIVFFIVQFIGLYLFSYHLDYTGLLFDIPSRVTGPPIGEFALWRPSGLTFEPGTYATYLMPLLYLSYIYSGYKIRKVHLLGLSTLALSLSVFAYIFITLFLFSGFVKKKNFFSLKNFFIVSFFSLPFYYFYNEYLSWRFMGQREDVSLSEKFLPIEFWLNQDVWRQFFGSGFGVNDSLLLVRDTSLAFNLIFTFGFFGFLLICFLFFISKGKAKKVLLAGFLLSKMPLFAPIFWMFLSLFLKSDDFYKDDEKRNRY